jgi:hypothetical protein
VLTDRVENGHRNLAIAARTSLLIEDWASLGWSDAGGAVFGRALELQKCGACQRLIMAQ